MNGKASINLEHDRLLVSGEIDFGTAVSLWNQSLPLLAQCKTLSFDFSNVVASNSAALALLIEWIKYANRKSKSITFQQIPPQIRSIAAMAGIDALLISHS